MGVPTRQIAMFPRYPAAIEHDVIHYNARFVDVRLNIIRRYIDYN